MENYVPLAERMRPKTLDQVAGQPQLTGENGILRKMLREKYLPSMLLWGPPGTGKTTLALIIAGESGRQFYQLSAVHAGVKDIKKILEKHKPGNLFSESPVVFIDEIHRFNKAQQDALLHAVEKGEIILIGATTENPGFEVNNALLSRMHTFILQPLNKEALRRLLDRALKEDVILKPKNVRLEDADMLVEMSGGDARKMFNLLEAAVLTAEGNFITREHVREVARDMPAVYDKSGDKHYEMASAMIKSIRGSDPDAAVYWMARMLEGGEDPLFIARRLVISAVEDVGLANPYALTVAEAGFSAVAKIGMPEAQIVLSEVIIYLTTSPKSNSAYKAIKKAMQTAKETRHLPVPLHLRNPANRLTKDLNYGKDYRYPHNYSGHFVQQNYFPENWTPPVFYYPADNINEQKIREILEKYWGRDYSSGE